MWTFSEATDALMDIFADNDWPKIIVELRLCDRIKNLQKAFHSKVCYNKFKNEYSDILLT